MTRFTLTPTEIAGVTRVERHPVGDDRGSLARIYDAAEPGLLPCPPAQINHTRTRLAGTIRGLHLQRPPVPEAKLIQCLRGRVFDVAVDLRAGSPTFGAWTAVELTEDNGLALLIPEGCAHGLQTLTDDCELLYLHSAPYTPEAEDGVHHASPAIGIRWPLPAAVLSARDACLAPLGPDFAPVELSQ